MLSLFLIFYDKIKKGFEGEKIMNKCRIGVDVGGTNVKIALVDENGEILFSNKDTIPCRNQRSHHPV